MFRRKEGDQKEEGFADSHNDHTTPITTTGGVSGTGSHNSSHVAQTNSGQSQTAAQTASYSPIPAVPSTQPVVRTISDVTRNAPAGAASAAAPNSGYRPSPVTEFNRGVSRTAQDAGRPVPGGAHSSLSFPHEKPSTKSTPRILTVGNDILLKGEIATCDRVVIEGRVEAKLSDVHTVEIAGCGSFKGTAEVEDAEVSGLFEGDLAVRNRLVIYATGEVRGNITYGEIEVERGGKITGQIKTVASGSTATSEKPNLLDVLDIKARSGKDNKEAGAA